MSVVRPTFPAAAHMSKEPRLAGKVAVISGASRGFGQAIAVRFVEEGARVVLLSRSPCDETFKLIASIEGAPPVDDVALWVASDISSEADCKKVTDATEAKWGDKIHVLVNNAALFVFESVEHATAEDWDRSAAVNIKGHALLTKVRRRSGAVACTGPPLGRGRSHPTPTLGPAAEPTQAVLPFMKRAGGGSIVFQGSISSFIAQPNCAT
jgi:NAD(P)-dependent dehydrogenase (short-subunit alcohol dehydrogenase family)